MLGCYPYLLLSHEDQEKHLERLGEAEVSIQQ